MDKSIWILCVASLISTTGYILGSIRNIDKKIARTMWGTGFFLAIVAVLKVAFSI